MRCNIAYANFKTACFVKYLSWQTSKTGMMRFSQDFYNRDSFDEAVKMRGNSPMLTSKLHVLFNILAPCWQNFHETFYNRDSFDETIKNLLYLEDLFYHPLPAAFNLHTHTHTYIYTYLWFHRKDLCEARPKLQSMFKFSDVLFALSQKDPK